MCARTAPRILVHMDEAPIAIHLDLRVSGDSLRGAVVDPAGQRAEFLGRVGLLAAIEEVVRTAAETDATPDSDRSQP
jgi:hypothetical protein